MPILALFRRHRGFSGWWVLAICAALAAMALVTADWYSAEPPAALLEATYLGRESCIQCHQVEHELFVGSDHDRAMELPTGESVVGDFDDTTFERLGVTTRFYRKGDEFWVNTEGPDGEYHDYKIAYTFGIDPLQQYMVEFPDGRVQVLRVSWDTKKNKWFYVPPPDAVGERLAPDDPTHWTGIAQNWNTTCAECHSTNLQKNYDLQSDTYHTTFSEIDVSCEACHGPGSLHVRLANQRSLFWDRRHGYGLAKLKSPDPTAQIEACAKCHSRRTEVHPDFRPGQPMGDFYDPSLIREGLYHADGQILDEVYVYGSFLQSRMHREGVRCTDCHDPHSLDLKFEGNALCAQCHVPARYDTPAHHHHAMGTAAAACVECHMPETTYMVIDPRRDHSIRVPRPDLTVSMGTPNVCNRCHVLPYETPQWAAEKVEEWYGPKRPDDPHWAPVLAAAREADPDALTDILEAIGRQTTPSIIKATLCELLARYDSPAAENALRGNLTSPYAIVRQAAAASISPSTPQQLVSDLMPMLADPVRSVRIAAALRLADIPPQSYRDGVPAALTDALQEYRTQLHMADERAIAHLQLAQLARREGKSDKSLEEIRTAIRLEPYLTGPRAELALMLSQSEGNDEEILKLRQEEAKLLERDIRLVPDNGEIRYRLGLLRYLLGDLPAAEDRLAEASRLEPRNYQFALGLALLQQARYKAGDEAAFDRTVQTLKNLAELAPDRPDAQNILRDLIAERQQRAGGNPSQDKQPDPAE